MDSQGGSIETCFTRRQYLPSLSINYVSRHYKKYHLCSWLYADANFTKIKVLFIVFDEFYPWHTVPQQSRVDLGVGRRVCGHPFFEILNYFYRILRKMKSIYIAGKWASDPPLKIYENDHPSCIRQTKKFYLTVFYWHWSCHTNVMKAVIYFICNRISLHQTKIKNCY